MKHKVAELEGALLDDAVTKAAGMTVEDRWHGREGAGFFPSQNWADGGPIIERERIELDPRPDSDPDRPWLAAIGRDYYYGPTPLIAAMRAFVASKLGAEVELP